MHLETGVFRRIILLLNLLALVAQYAVCTPFAITGPRTFGLGIQPRLEIRDMMRDRPVMYNLYILALQAFHAEGQDQKLSFFQIAAIHGYPNIAWDNVTGEATGIGYCVHQDELFVTWHRPYVALFEQRLQNYALKIAKQFKEGQKRQKYIEEAKKLRSAYWDWARPLKEHEKKTFPEIFTATHVSVEIPNGEQQKIANPFYQYRFHPLKPTFFDSYYKQMHSTLRYPSAENASTATSDNDMASQYIAATRPSWQSDLYGIFVNCDKFFQLTDGRHPGNSKSTTRSKCPISLETLHGDVHAKVGGFTNHLAGHMTEQLMSSFDPMFFLHHTNVDRIIAMWQVLNPTQYVYKSTVSTTTYIFKKGQSVDQDTALKPFHRNAKGDFWTSREIRDHRTFQSTYPEFLRGGHDPSTMRKIINKLYMPKSDQGSKADPSARPRTQPLIAAKSTSIEYMANVATTKNKLGGSYSTYLFLGEPASSTDPRSWVNDANFVGSLSTFSSSHMMDDDTVVTSLISLTDSLYKRVSSDMLQNLSEITVVPTLTKELQWKVVGPDGTLIDPASVPDFLVSVYVASVAPAEDDTQFPEWSDLVPLPSVTSGKPGGAR